MTASSFIRVFLLVVGNASAILLALLALETTPVNFLGWFLLAISIAYGAGGAFYLWINRDRERTARSESGNRSFWWLLPGFSAVFFAPLVEFLFLPAFLPRNLGMEIAGLLIILLGLALCAWTRLTAWGTQISNIVLINCPLLFSRTSCNILARTVGCPPHPAVRAFLSTSRRPAGFLFLERR